MFSLSGYILDALKSAGYTKVDGIAWNAEKIKARIDFHSDATPAEKAAIIAFVKDLVQNRDSIKQTEEAKASKDLTIQKLASLLISKGIITQDELDKL